MYLTRGWQLGLSAQRKHPDHSLPAQATEQQFVGMRKKLQCAASCSCHLVSQHGCHFTTTTLAYPLRFTTHGLADQVCANSQNQFDLHACPTKENISMTSVSVTYSHVHGWRTMARSSCKHANLTRHLMQTISRQAMHTYSHLADTCRNILHVI